LHTNPGALMLFVGWQEGPNQSTLVESTACQIWCIFIEL